MPKAWPEKFKRRKTKSDLQIAMFSKNSRIGPKQVSQSKMSCLYSLWTELIHRGKFASFHRHFAYFGSDFSQHRIEAIPGKSIKTDPESLNFTERKCDCMCFKIGKNCTNNKKKNKIINRNTWGPYLKFLSVPHSHKRAPEVKVDKFLENLNGALFHSWFAV